MEPADMPDQHTNPNTVLSSGLHRLNNSAANEHMPRSLWQPGVVQRLADYIKRVREVDHQPHERHVCRLNASYTCACPTHACANDDATYRHARGPYIVAKRCPVTGQPCAGADCRDWCESGVDYSKT